MALQWQSLLERLRARLPARAPANGLRGIAVSVNAEYAQAAHILHDGDEVGLLPPVSGGGTSRNGERFGRKRRGEPAAIAVL